MGDLKNQENHTITFVINVVLFLYFISLSILNYLTQPESIRAAPLESFFEGSPLTLIFFLIIIALLIILLGAKLFKIIWNRLFSNLFSFRNIDLNEALAIILSVLILSELCS